MKIYDITQELLQGKVYPGDPVPVSERICKMEEGDLCNVTTLSMCVHNGTHIDAPYHFYEHGVTVDQIDLEKCIGNCILLDEIEFQFQSLQRILVQGYKRILLKGNCEITLEISRLFNQYNVMLIGVESQSVGPVDGPMPVHLELLGQGVVLLEGLVLQGIESGEYFLVAQPLKVGGSDGAPCRAVLLEGINE